MSTNVMEKRSADRSEVLTKALLKAGKELGLNQKMIGKIIGKDQSSISRGAVSPESKSGEIAKILIRCYRSLYAMVGGNVEQMRHWMQTENLHTGGVPAQQLTSIEGLTTVVRYLDAIRGKV